MSRYGEIAFPKSTNANKHTLLALGSDCMARDDVKISRSGGQSAYSLFSCVKPCETNLQQMLYIML